MAPNRYNFESPGAAATGALEDFLLRQQAQKRQQMLDDLNRQVQEQNMAASKASTESLVAQREAAEEERRLKMAGVETSTLRPGQTVSADAAPNARKMLPHLFQDTVTQGQQIGTADELGPDIPLYETEQSTQFSGTPAQVEAQRLQQEMQAFLQEDFSENPEMKRIQDYVKAQQITGDSSLPYQLFEKEKETPRTGIIGEYEYDAAQRKAAGLPPITFDQYQTQDANRKRSIAQGNVRLGDLTDQQFRRSQQLESDFARDSKDFIERTNSYRTIQSAASDNSAAGDLSIIFAYMKMLDPGSVVREGEFATAQNTVGVPDRVRNIYNRAISGERLAPAQRQDFINQGKNIYQGAKKNQQTVKTRYESRAKAAGVPAEFVITDFDSDIPTEPTSAGTGSGDTGVIRWGVDANGNPVRLQ